MILAGVVFSILPLPKFTFLDPYAEKLKDYLEKRNKRLHYSKYISSHAWRKKALKRKIIDKFKCKGKNCAGGDPVLHVHHLTYRRLRRERMSDLITVCSTCHNKIHASERKKKNGKS